MLQDLPVTGAVVATATGAFVATATGAEVATGAVVTAGVTVAGVAAWTPEAATRREASSSAVVQDGSLMLVLPLLQAASSC